MRSSEDSSFNLDRYINDLILHFIFHVSPSWILVTLSHSVSPLLSEFLFVCFLSPRLLSPFVSLEAKFISRDPDFISQFSFYVRKCNIMVSRLLQNLDLLVMLWQAIISMREVKTGPGAQRSSGSTQLNRLGGNREWTITRSLKMRKSPWWRRSFAWESLCWSSHNVIKFKIQSLSSGCTSLVCFFVFFL